MKWKRIRNAFFISRREFGQRLALLSGAAIVPPADAGATAIDPHSGGPAGHHDPLNQSDAAPQNLSAEGRVRFESMWQNVLRKYASRLTDDQKTRMRKIIANNVTMLEAVYAVPLKNGDAPATILRLVEATPSTRRAVTRRPASAGAKPAKRKSSDEEK